MPCRSVLYRSVLFCAMPFRAVPFPSIPFYCTLYSEYAHLPKVRKLNEDDKAHVSELIAMGADKKFIQQQMSTATGKPVTMKDLRNIENRHKQQQQQQQKRNKSDISRCVEKLRNEYNCNIDLLVDSDDTHCGFFAQDSQMRSTFEAYPEIINLDAPYRSLK